MGDAKHSVSYVTHVLNEKDAKHVLHILTARKAFALITGEFSLKLA